MKKRYMILRTLYDLGIVYKTDLSKYATYVYGNASDTSKMLKQLMEEGFIIEYEALKKQNGGSTTYTVLKITSKGRTRIEELFPDDKEYYHTNEATLEATAHIDNPTRLELVLRHARVKYMFAACDFTTAPREKPSLYHLVHILRETPQEEWNEKAFHNKLYKDNLKKEECQALLKKGIYYSINEIKAYFNTFEHKQTETIQFSKAKGILIKEDDFFVVYCTKRSESRQIKITNGEKNLLTLLQELVDLTNTERRVPQMDSLKININNNYIVDQPYSNAVSAIIISDTTALTSAMVMSSAHGVLKTNKKKKLILENKWLNADCNLFNKIYSVPFTNDGMGQLQILCESSAEEKDNYARTLFSNMPHFTLNATNPVYRGDYHSEKENLPSVYIPYYDIKLLRDISQLSIKIAIITYPDMIDTIAHSIRQEMSYFIFNSNDELELVPPQSIGIYGETGKLKGYEKVLEEIERRGEVSDHKKIISLPKQYGEETIEFFNNVVNEKYDIEQIVEDMNLKSIAEKVQPSQKQQISVTVPKELYPYIKAAAYGKNISPTKYINQILEESYDRIKEEAKGKSERRAKAKANWNK